MNNRISSLIGRLAMEPPFRILARAVLKRMNVSVHTRSLWELSQRPAYLLGLLTAAEQAARQGVPEISAIEFGVAGGDGLVAMQSDAAIVEHETGVKIRVFGFDNGGKGLPAFIGDFRDHPDVWQPGDFPMDEARLRARLTSRTTLILGEVSKTLPGFFSEFNAPPVGFVSVDVDLYSSTRDALQLFSLPEMKMLWHVPVYFDDIDFLFNHRFAGELLAIDEFNQAHATVKIDRWYGVANGRPFPERPFLSKMFVAHWLPAIPGAAQRRAAAVLPLGGVAA